MEEVTECSCSCWLGLATDRAIGRIEAYSVSVKRKGWGARVGGRRNYPAGKEERAMEGLWAVCYRL